jgi:putative transposase
MCLRFVFLLITRLAAWLRLCRREEAWKTAEILILRHQVAILQRRQPRRPKLNWADRALLAALLGVIPKARRHGLRLLVTPGTILRWHRDIVRRRWAARPMRGRTDRPAIRRNIKALVLRLARENAEWGYRRIHGELAGLGVKVAASTVWEILKASGVDPAQLRRTGPTWPQLLRSQAEAILACDFFMVDLLDGTQAHVLAVIEHATRRIRILGIILHPSGEWTTQQARNLFMDLGGQAERMKFMISDRGSNLTAAFDAVLADAGIRTVLCNVRTPRMNAIAERWIGGCRRELLDRTLVWNQAHLRRVLRDYEIHHNQHRPHRSLHGAAPLKPLPEPVDLDQYRVRRQKTRVGTIKRLSPRRMTWMRFSAPTGVGQVTTGCRRAGSLFVRAQRIPARLVRGSRLLAAGLLAAVLPDGSLRGAGNPFRSADWI